MFFMGGGGCMEEYFAMLPLGGVNVKRFYKVALNFIVKVTP